MGHVKARRSVIYPNPGFQRQLLDFEKKLINSRRGTVMLADSMNKGHQQHLAQNSPLNFL